ncbi:glycosyltransferase family 1 protein [Haliscomenobacter hydrossis]|uniref:Glycosyltransferase subfamily 4-like N-terminal domain-containing protein n=1 Tax=Haliscomenobacter hydrossis (strain ATCC 27775 / DSM 1100 / LMG 10767 / O) TaxID=760192 RepID=F4L446_HALH1|nr:glycosyltransferase family 1 protein [Haliscomenobacter hydrossis]AEE50744.1 hypothetical protein Halhy_2879 [Haliscomenobacter hydrossis DSM 1100]
MSKICLVTPGHLHSNPRLRKEVLALKQTGYQVSVFAIQTLQELIPFDHNFVEANPEVEFHFLKATKRTTWDYLRIKTNMRKRLYTMLFRWQKSFSIKAFARFYVEQVRMVQTCKADLYIAHNLAALPVAAAVARYHCKPFAFDAEDFHRGEFEADSLEAHLIQFIEDKFIPKVAYLSAASPLIAEAYQQLYSPVTPIVINNVFALDQQPPAPKVTNKKGHGSLKLFWFSQTVGTNRGIQDVLNALKLLPDIPVQIGLLGSCDESTQLYFQSFIQSPQHQLEFFSQCTEQELIDLSAQYDIGLATEPGFSSNNDKALSNKIFTYLLAGNAILASNTNAQKHFMQFYSNIGASYPIGGLEEIAKYLRNWWAHYDELQNIRQAAWTLARQELNWDKEQICFLDVIKRTI